MIPSISQICSLMSPFESDIEDYAAGNCKAIDLWCGKLEAYLEEHSLDEVRRLLTLHEVSAAALSFQGGILAAQGEKRKEAWKLFEQRLTLCRDLSIPTFVVACDTAGPLQSSDVERVQVSLTQAADLAGDYGVRLAIEFQASASFGNNLQTMASLVEATNRPNVGICLDAFHFCCGPSKESDLQLLSNENLFHVQLSDLADVPRESATDSHRIMPGEGDAPLAAILERLRTIRYSGCVSIELMNPQIWQVPALQFGEVAMSSLSRLLCNEPATPSSGGCTS